MRRVSSALDLLVPPATRGALAAVVRRRTAVLGFTGAVAMLATIIAFLLPVSYQAEATLLPPAEGEDSFGSMASLIQSAALNRIGLFTTQTPSDVFAEILRSRTLREELVKRFDLQRRYGKRNLDQALRELAKHSTIEVNKAGVLFVRVRDRDPQRAAEMANALVAGLDRFNRDTYTTRAKRVRQFLDGRLADVTDRLARAESTLTAYEQRNRVLAGSDRNAVEGLAAIMAQRMSLQVKRTYLSSYLRASDPLVRELDSEISAYERELARMPALKQRGARLALEAELQRRLFTLITAQLEDARVQEMRDTPTVTVLDSARAPLIRHQPRRSLIVFAAAATALALSAAWVVLDERAAAMRA